MRAEEHYENIVNFLDYFGDDDFVSNPNENLIFTATDLPDGIALSSGGVLSGSLHFVETPTNYSSEPFEETFVVSVQNGTYLIDGSPQPELNLEVGKKYRFDVSHPSNMGHEFSLSEHSDGRHNSDYYDSWYGEQGLPFQFGWGPNFSQGEWCICRYIYPSDYTNFFSQIHYFCGVQSGMGGLSNVSTTPFSSATENVQIYDITVTAKDSYGKETSENISIEVEKPSVKLDTLLDQTTDEDASFTYQLSATKPADEATITFIAGSLNQTDLELSPVFMGHREIYLLVI